VKWLSKKPTKRDIFKSPPAKRGPKFSHKMVALPSGTKNRRCDPCADIARLPSRADVKQFRSRASVALCRACNKVLFDYCAAHN